MITKMRVLLVDDDEIHREVTHRMLDDRFELHDAETGEQALTLLDRLAFGCVLLDNRLPDYTGIELLPLIAEYKLPVVMMSSVITERLVDEAQAAGCDQVLSKDRVTADKLTEAISAVATAVACATDSGV